MGGDSRTRGRVFESRILDGHFSHYIVKNCNVCLKRPKINDKKGRGWPITKSLVYGVIDLNTTGGY